MAAVQLSGSGAAPRTSLPSYEELRLSPSISRVFFSGGIKLDRRRFRKPKLSVSMCLNESGTGTPGFNTNTALKYTEDDQDQLMDEPGISYITAEPSSGKVEMDMHVIKDGAVQQKRYAKIHDFCLGIPFGGFIFGGGLFGFLFTRNPASLTTGVLFGGGILALGAYSLKVWRKGKSSLPFTLAQAAIAATLLWKHFQLYSSTKKLFPSGFYVAISAAMICFYSYVLISGGNPPPKKLAAAPPS